MEFTITTIVGIASAVFAESVPATQPDWQLQIIAPYRLELSGPSMLAIPSAQPSGPLKVVDVKVSFKPVFRSPLHELRQVRLRRPGDLIDDRR
ncbi:MAG TPA: hypothetical protein VF624_07860 [Tepidisphaeraceae bacterium]|jgi:hypothetical protein